MPEKKDLWIAGQLAPILSALAVEAQFELELLEEHALKKVAARRLDALLTAP